MEEVRWIVLGLDLDQAIIIGDVGCPRPLSSLLSYRIYVYRVVNVWTHGVVKFSCPCDIRVCFRRIGPLCQDVEVEAITAVWKCRLSHRDSARCAMHVLNENQRKWRGLASCGLNKVV